MLSVMMFLVFASFGVNIAVGSYFLILAKNKIEAPVFSLWASSCFVYCLGLAFSVVGVLPDVSSVFYFIASYLLLAGFLRLNSGSAKLNTRRWARVTPAAGVTAIVLMAIFTQYHQAFASAAIAVVFLLCLRVFNASQDHVLPGIRRFFRAVLAVHAGVMACQSVMLAYNEWAQLGSVMQNFTGVSIAAHIALCITTSVLLPFFIITQQKHKWETLANIDELTGLFGRRAFIRQANERLAKEDAMSCSLMVIDIDHFKTINDEYGHPTGDSVLKVIASELHSELDDSQIIGRLGGEEFAILVSDESRLEAFKLADVLRKKIETLEIKEGNASVSVTISIGMTFSTSIEDTWHSLFNRADTELYNAKSRGRNQISPRLQVVA